MAKELSSLTNVDAPAGNFSKGKIRDNDGTRNGTPVNVDLLSDVTQFFAKLMADAGVAPNNSLDDQVTNQYMQALKLTERSYVDESTVTAESTDPGLPAGYTGFEFDTTAIIIDLPGSIANDVVSFKTDIPVGNVIKIYVDPTSGGFDIIVNSTNLGGGYTKPIKQAGVSANNQAISVGPPAGGAGFTITVFDTFYLLEQH